MTTPTTPTAAPLTPDVRSPGVGAPDALDALAEAGRAAHAAAQAPGLVTPGILAELALEARRETEADGLADALDATEAAEERAGSARLEIHRLQEQLKRYETSTGCVWCGSVVEVGELGKADALAKIREHVMTCPESPLVKEVRHLRGEAEAYCWHHEQLATANQRLAEVENMRATLADQHLRRGEELAAVEKQLDTSTELLGAMGATINLLETRRARWCKRAVDAEQLVLAKAQIIAMKNRELTEATLQRDLHAKDTDTLNALEHKLWAMLGGPVEPNEDVAERVREEFDRHAETQEVLAKTWAAIGIEPGASVVLPSCVAALQARCEKAEKSAAEAISPDPLPNIAEPKFRVGVWVEVNADHMAGQVTFNRYAAVTSEWMVTIRATDDKLYTFAEHCLSLLIPF